MINFKLYNNFFLFLFFFCWKMSFAIITVTDDINFLFTDMDAIIWLFRVCGCFCFFFFDFARSSSFVVVGFGFLVSKRHNHSKPQIKCNSKSRRERVQCGNAHERWVITWAIRFHEKCCNQPKRENFARRRIAPPTMYLIWYFLWSMGNGSLSSRFISLIRRNKIFAGNNNPTDVLIAWETSASYLIQWK